MYFEMAIKDKKLADLNYKNMMEDFDSSNKQQRFNSCDTE